MRGNLSLFAIALFFIAPLTAADSKLNKSQISYLVQANQLESALDLYQQYQTSIGKHDFEVLTEFALILLGQGARSSDQENQLLSIYGSGIANMSASLDALEAGIKSTHPETQMASIQFLGRFQDDRSDELLIKAMSSDFFPVRLEAAFQLATRKHRASVGQIESLMYRVPPPFRFLFPQFFALIGTSDAIAILRHLMEDAYVSVRVEAILSAARFDRDDLLPSLRALLTHLNVAEQETAAYAVGKLKDSKSLARLKKLKHSPEDAVAIAASRALVELGVGSAKELLLKKARECNLFAIGALGEVKEGADLLAQLCHHSDLQVRINAGISLIKLRDARCLPALKEIMISDTRDLGFQPMFSLGKSLLAWKVVASTSQHQKNGTYDLQSISSALRLELLKEAIELPEKAFLKLAEGLFKSKQTDLIPLLVELLANRHTDACLGLLKQMVQQAGAPLIRGYANLQLYRLQVEGPYSDNLKAWMVRNKEAEMIRFKPLVSIDQRFGEGGFELTPEDNSRLFVECTQALADRHEPAAIDLLLEMIRLGNPKNRYVLAGLLLRALQ